MLLLGGMVAGLVLASGPASAQVVADSLTHKKFGIVPTVTVSNNTPAPNSPCNAEHSDCTALSYNGGPVQHAEKDYLLFWTPSGHTAPSAYRSGMATWLNGIAADDYTHLTPISVNQQYYDLSGHGGAKSFVPFGVTNGGSLIDTHPYPANGCTDHDAAGHTLPICLTDAQIASQVSSYVTSHSLPTGINVEYFVLTPVNVGSCFSSASTSCSYTAYCGYHTYSGTGASQVVYADMPYAYGVSGCDVNLAFGAGYPNVGGIDPVVGIFSHELSETMTDPNLNAWFQIGGTDHGYEIGDKCAYIYGAGGYGSMTGLSNNGSGYWNVGLGTKQYLMQMEFDNRLTNCAITNTDTQPSATIQISPNHPVHGSSATFTAHITDPITPYTVQWSFGDGTSRTGNPVTHTYATAGTKSLSVIVTDGHGNQKRLTQALNVS